MVGMQRAKGKNKKVKHHQETTLLVTIRHSSWEATTN